MGSNTAKTSMAAQETLRPEIMYYTVKAGDTVLGIANKFGLQPETLMWSNSFIEQNPDRLSIGDSLRILPVDGVIHVIARGDTLSSIADDYDTAMQAIVDYAANRIAGLDDTLPIGKEIVVPGGSKPFVATYVGASTAYSVARPPGAMAGSGNFSWPTAGYISQWYWGGIQLWTSQVGWVRQSQRLMAVMSFSPVAVGTVAMGTTSLSTMETASRPSTLI